MAQHESLLHLDAAVVGMQVGAADRGALDPQQHVVRLLDLGPGNLLDPHVVRAVEDDGLHGVHARDLIAV